mmetsp:Transcript_97145/g.278014  ORF Transcript_97145/g.278014 Transcript_97145/m.278014 type:complete len:121 (-) Transcript_97145:747-1109(-)
MATTNKGHTCRTICTRRTGCAGRTGHGQGVDKHKDDMAAAAAASTSISIRCTDLDTDYKDLLTAIQGTVVFFARHSFAATRHGATTDMETDNASTDGRLQGRGRDAPVMQQETPMVPLPS